MSEEQDSQLEDQDVDPGTSVVERLPDDIKKIFDDILKFRIDPAGLCYNITLEQIIQSIGNICTNKVAAIMDNGNLTQGIQPNMYDYILSSFVRGCGGQISHWDREEKSSTPIVLRGITKRKVMRTCAEQGRDFYYIDTGYFGNNRKKIYHRITKNAVQNFGPIIDRPGDRLQQTGQKFRKFRRDGSKILLAPPSQKLLNFYDINLDSWMAETITQIQRFTDREIVIRLKQGRSVRQTTDTIEMALDRDIYCLVTYSSIAAGEALLYGKPAITLGPNAAAPLCSQHLKEIENIKIPTLDEVEAWARHLSYCQFTVPEMENGTAWRILNDT
jgi:hypothetical protein